MIKEQIQECIQKILDNELGGISTNNCPRGGIEKYGYMTAYRLSKYVNFYRTRRISLDDFLISLRNYLLVFQTAVRLPIDIDITDNKYGLRIDSEGLCYATLNLPDYLNIDIIKQGFMVDYVEPEKDERYFLGVTPNIYRLTGFQRFKSIRQKLAVNGALNMPEGYTALVSLPTGGGKSLITQAMAYQKNDGLTITVVPTVSLAMDQVRVAIKVVAAIIIDNGKVFATQRGYGEFKDGWEFPGGKIEEGETAREAIVREIREELDTEIQVEELLDTVEYDYPKFHLSMDCFICTVKSGDLVLKEHEAAKWLTKETLGSVEWLPADEGLIEKIREYIQKN